MKKILIIEDDVLFAASLVRVLARRDYQCFIAANSGEAIKLCQEIQPEHILLDLQLGEEQGLLLIPSILKMVSQCKIIILTGYGTIETAVMAMKQGAHHYLCKPASADAILAALEEEKPQTQEANLHVLTENHIKNMLQQNEGNISQTARALGLHRRTLQRRLKKYHIPNPLTKNNV